MATQTKEEFYVRRRFDDDAPVFTDATTYARRRLPYPLGTKRSLKATCGVRTDDTVVAFSLRSYSGRQVDREVENIADATPAQQNQLRLHMPRKTLYGLTETARALAGQLGDEVIAELNGELHVLSLHRAGAEAELELTAKLVGTPDGYTRVAAADTPFELPVAGVRLRVFLRSPVRDRILAYAFGGYLTRKPGEAETVTRATALALNDILDLATFRMLSALDRVAVPPLRSVSERRTLDPVSQEIPVILFAADGTPAARGRINAELDLAQVDPVTGTLRIQVTPADHLEWNPAAPGSPDFETYERVLTTTVETALHSALGPEAVRDLEYNIMLGDLPPEAPSALRTALALPGLTATPTTSEIRPL